MNAYTELEEKIQQYQITLLFGEVWYSPEPGECHTFTITSSNLAEFNEWMASINYDPGYGRQFLGGCIWVETPKGEITTLTRSEHDGAEWWSLGNFIPVSQRLAEKIGPTWMVRSLKDGRPFLVNAKERAVYPNGCFPINDLLNYMDLIELI